MEVRLSDLYELIIRIIDDRLKQRVETERALAARDGNTFFTNSGERSPRKEETLLQTLLDQMTDLVNLQRQLLEAFQTNQRRTEALLNDLLNLMKQQVEVSRTGNGRRLIQPLSNEEEPTIERGSDKESTLKKPSEHRPDARNDKVHEISPKGYATMMPPDPSEEEVSFVSSDNWLKEPLPQPPTSELAPDGVSTPTLSTSPSHMELLTDQLSSYLRRLFGIEVDYLRVRQTLSSLSSQDTQVLVGEGTYNGQLVILTIFGKSHITPTDITVFYNAVVRPLRDSVTEPVMSIVFGESFESKALKIAHALDLLVVNLRDLREINGREN